MSFPWLDGMDGTLEGVSVPTLVISRSSNLEALKDTKPKP